MFILLCISWKYIQFEILHDHTNTVANYVEFPKNFMYSNFKFLHLTLFLHILTIYPNNIYLFRHSSSNSLHFEVFHDHINIRNFDYFSNFQEQVSLDIGYVCHKLYMCKIWRFSQVNDFFAIWSDYIPTSK